VVRSRLESCLERVPPADLLVLASSEPELAQLAAADLTELGHAVRVLEGGTRGWTRVGLPTEAGLENATTEADDLWLRPYQQRGPLESWMREYLSWEVALPELIERDGDAGFRRFDLGP
jgi:hypothetical protein